MSTSMQWLGAALAGAAAGVVLAVGLCAPSPATAIEVYPAHADMYCKYANPIYQTPNRTEVAGPCNLNDAVTGWCYTGVDGSSELWASVTDTDDHVSGWIEVWSLGFTGDGNDTLDHC